MDWFNSMLFGGAIIGAMTALWGYIKAFTWRIISTLVRQTSMTGHLTNFFVSELARRYTMSRVYDAYYTCTNEYVRSARSSQTVSYEYLGTAPLVFWRGWIPFLVTFNKNSGGTAVVVTSLRGTLPFDDIMASAAARYNELQSGAVNRYFVKKLPPPINTKKEEDKARDSNYWFRLETHRVVSHEQGELGWNPSEAFGAKQLVLAPEIKSLVNELRLWRDHRDWYNERGIPWRRGWLLYGPPGSGKTSLVRGVAVDLDLPLFVFNLAQMSNGTLTEAWAEMQTHAPCVALIEDIDNVFHGRKNITLADRGYGAYGSMRQLASSPPPAQPAASGSGSTSAGSVLTTDHDADDKPGLGFGVTFDTLLNCLDGVVPSEGVFTVITTNHLDKVDEALASLPEEGQMASRPGRIDRVLHISWMTPDCKRQLAQKILGEYPAELEQVLEHIDKQETVAQWQERCAQLALRAKWAEVAASQQGEKS